MTKAILIIAPDNFRDEELFNTKSALESAGVDITVASKTTDVAGGMRGGTAKPDITIDDIKIDEYDALILVGGTGSSIYFNDSKVHAIAKDTFSKGKIIAAICIASSTLANAGILNGKKATCYDSEADNLKSKGAIYTGNPVEVDGNIITADGPSSASEFGRMIAIALG